MAISSLSPMSKAPRATESRIKAMAASFSPRKMENSIRLLVRPVGAKAFGSGSIASTPTLCGSWLFSGNCDLCFLKGMSKTKQIMKDRPDLANWWIEAEAERIGVRNPSVAFFRKDRPRYAKLLELSQLPGLFDGHEPDELSIACHCTD